MSNTVDCENCFYNQGGCRCEELMAAGCIPTPLTTKEKGERAEAILKDFTATINTIQEIITDPLFIKAYKRRYKKQFGGAVIRNNPIKEQNQGETE